MDYREEYRTRIVNLSIASRLVLRPQLILREDVTRWMADSGIVWYTKICPSVVNPAQVTIVFDGPAEALLFRMRWL